MALTVKQVAKAMARGEKVRLCDGRGLYLVVDSATAASWNKRYEFRGKKHWMGLGSARTFTLDEARDRNRDIAKLLDRGCDPLAQRRAEEDAALAESMRARTFEQCALDYMNRHEAGWRPATGRLWRHYFKEYVFPKIGNLPVSIIDRACVLNVLEQPATVGKNKRWNKEGKLWDVRTWTASQIRNQIERTLDFAMSAGYRPTENGNPASWKLLKHVLGDPAKIAPSKHHPALPYAEMPAFFTKLRELEPYYFGIAGGGSSKHALEFIILTAVRLTEATEAQWSEFDLGAAVWTIPAERMKEGREHKVPLSPAALTLLESLPTESGNPHVFIGTKTYNTGAIRTGYVARSSVSAISPRLGYKITVHGFRSTFSDWAHEQTAFDNHTIEISLAHAVGNDVEKAYRRGHMFDKRRKLMEAWADYCCEASGVKSATVLPIRKAQA